MKKFIVQVCKNIIKKLDRTVLIPENMNYKMASNSILLQSKKGKHVFFSILMDKMSIEQIEELVKQARAKKYYKTKKNIKVIYEEKKGI